MIIDEWGLVFCGAKIVVFIEMDRDLFSQKWENKNLLHTLLIKLNK
jgi:hypothetical protein